MLQRTGNRPPSPLRSYPNDATIFNKDGKLKEQYHKLCQEINISPEELYPRDLESFRETNTTRNVQILRYNNYENKRRAKLEALRAVAKQRNIIPPSKPARPGTTSPRSRTMSFPNNPESMSNIDKESHRHPQAPTRDFSSNLHTKASENGLQGGHVHGRRSIYETSPLISTGFPRGSPGRKEVSAEKIKGVDSNYAIDADECYMVDDMEEKFKKYMKQKEKQKERMLNASTIVTRRDEEYREELKKAYQAKVDKWNKKKETMAKKKKTNNDDEEYRREKIERQREAQRETQQALFERVQNKMEKSVRQKRDALEERVNKLARLNTTLQERYFTCLEKREANSSVFMGDVLVDIENKFTATDFRKRKFIEERKIEATKHLEGIEGRRQKVIEGKEEESKIRLEKLIAKMEKEKERCKSAVPAKKKVDKGPRPIEENTEYMERMEERNIKEIETEKQKLDSFHEKQKRVALKLEQRKANMSEVIAERRELWSQKLESINENKEIANEASEKYLEHKIRSYKERVAQIRRIKEDRKRQLAKLNRTFA